MWGAPGALIDTLVGAEEREGAVGLPLPSRCSSQPHTISNGSPSHEPRPQRGSSTERRLDEANRVLRGNPDGGMTLWWGARCYCSGLAPLTERHLGSPVMI